MKIEEADLWEVMLDTDLLPLQTCPGRNTPWKCIHIPCGRTVKPTYTAIKQRRTKGCIDCAGNTVEHGQVIQDMLAKDLEPQERYPGSQNLWECICRKCGQTVWARYHHVKHRGAGCPHCIKRCPKTCPCRTT